MELVRTVTVTFGAVVSAVRHLAQGVSQVGGREEIGVVQDDSLRFLLAGPLAHAGQRSQPDIVNILAASGFLSHLGAVNPASFAGRKGFVERQIFQVRIQRLAVHREGWRALRTRLGGV